jgi:hypothetical protein
MVVFGWVINTLLRNTQRDDVKKDLKMDYNLHLS